MKCVLVLAVVAMLCLITVIQAAVWYVHPDSSMNCIQHCLDSCSTDDTVLVGPGTYYENIIWPSMAGIDLIGELGADFTVIDGDSSGTVIS